MNINIEPTRPSGIDIIEGAGTYHVADAAQTWQYRFPRSVKALLQLRELIEYLIAISGGTARAPRVLPHGISILRHQTFHRVIGLDQKRGHDELFQVIIPSDPDALDRLAATIDYLQYHQRKEKRAVSPTAATAFCALFATALFLFIGAGPVQAQRTSPRTRAWCIDQPWLGLGTPLSDGTIAYIFVGSWTEQQKVRFLSRCDAYNREVMRKFFCCLTNGTATAGAGTSPTLSTAIPFARKWGTVTGEVKRQYAHAHQRRRRGSSPTVREGVDPAKILAAAIARRHPLLYLVWTQVPWATLKAQLNASHQPMPSTFRALPPRCVVGQRAIADGKIYVCMRPPRPTLNSRSETSKLLLRSAQDRLYRTQLREASTRPANFAQHYILAVWGCGSECLLGAAIDTRSGRVAWLPFAICCWFTSPGDPSSPLLFRLDSNVVIVNGKIITAAESREAHYAIYRLVNGRFVR